MPFFEIFAYNYTNFAITVTDSTFEPVWDEDDYLTMQYQNGSFVIPANYTLASGNNYGFDYDYSSSPSGEPGPIVFDTLGFGLYKISTIVNYTEYYFYLDIRDENMNSPIDISLKFDDSQWHWKWASGCDTGATMVWTAIVNNPTTTMTIWGLFGDCAYWTNG